VYTFRVRHLEVDLFGVVEHADSEPWLASFATAGKLEPVTVDDDAMEMIASELELELEGIAVSAARYVAGNYRPKAKGLGGARCNAGHLGRFLDGEAAGRFRA
jgi:hypothetical protein